MSKVSKLSGYAWDEEKDAFVKEYGKDPHGATLKYLVRFMYEGEKHIAIMYLPLGYSSGNVKDTVCFLTGTLFEDVRFISFNDISEVYSVNFDADMLMHLKKYKEMKEKKVQHRKAVGIIWETDGVSIDDLPEEVDIPDSVDDDDILDYLSDEHEYLVKDHKVVLCDRYELTEEGKKRCREYIAELYAKRKEILDARKDTADDTDIPTVEDICDDIDFCGAPEGEYYNGWSVTDNYEADYPILLKLGRDYTGVA